MSYSVHGRFSTHSFTDDSGRVALRARGNNFKHHLPRQWQIRYHQSGSDWNSGGRDRLGAFDFAAVRHSAPYRPSDLLPASILTETQENFEVAPSPCKPKSKTVFHPRFANAAVCLLNGAKSGRETGIRSSTAQRNVRVELSLWFDGDLICTDSFSLEGVYQSV